MIYMAADDAVAIPEAMKFLAEFHELKWLVKEKAEERSIRIFLQAYTDWSIKDDTEDFHARLFEICPGIYDERGVEIDSGFSLNKPLKELRNADMGTSQALEEFLVYCKNESPSDNSMLFLWGHGTGSGMFNEKINEDDFYKKIRTLYPNLTLTELDTGRSINKLSDLVDETNEFFKNKKKFRIKISYTGNDADGISDYIIVNTRKSVLFKLKQDKLTLMDLIPDRSRQNELSPDAERIRRYLNTRSELDALLEGEIRKSLKNEGVSVLMIMGCCMQMIEFAYEIKDKCQYFIGSEELIYFNGYNYFDSFTALFEYPDMDARSFARRIVQETPMKQTYTEFERHSLAISCVDLTKSKKLVDLLNDFAGKILTLKADDRIWEVLQNARKLCRHFGEDAYTYSFIDVAWFFKKVYEQIEPPKRKFKELRKPVKDIYNFLVEYYITESWIGFHRSPRIRYGRPTDGPPDRSYGGHGVGIYFPESLDAHKKNPDYMRKFFEPENEFTNLFTEKDSVQSNWHKMITEYMNRFLVADQYPVNPVSVDPQSLKLINDNRMLKQMVADLVSVVNIDDLKNIIRKQTEYTTPVE